MSDPRGRHDARIGACREWKERKAGRGLWEWKRGRSTATVVMPYSRLNPRLENLCLFSFFDENVNPAETWRPANDREQPRQGSGKCSHELKRFVIFRLCHVWLVRGKNFDSSPGKTRVILVRWHGIRARSRTWRVILQLWIFIFTVISTELRYVHKDSTC